MKCSQCAGTGEAKEPGYRDNAAPKKQTPKAPRKRAVIVNNICMWWSLYWDRVVLVVVLGGLICGSFYFFHTALPKLNAAHAAADYKKEKDDDNAGLVMVEYAADGTPIRCIVEKGNTYTPVGKAAYMAIRNRQDKVYVDKWAKIMGFEDSSKCIVVHYAVDDR